VGDLHIDGTQEEWRRKRNNIFVVVVGGSSSKFYFIMVTMSLMVYHDFQWAIINGRTGHRDQVGQSKLTPSHLPNKLRIRALVITLTHSILTFPLQHPLVDNTSPLNSPREERGCQAKHRVYEDNVNNSK